MASVGPIKDGRVRVQITEQMGTGACVLYVYGSNGKNSEMVVDMHLISKRPGYCPKVGFQFLNKNEKNS